MNTGIYIVSNNSGIHGIVDYTRWNEAKWYQRLLGKFWEDYRQGFLDVTPIQSESLTIDQKFIEDRISKSNPDTMKWYPHPDEYEKIGKCSNCGHKD